MRYLILFAALAAGLCLESCYNEDPLNVPDQEDKYGVLKDDATDATRHFAYQFYQQYETVIITNPTDADYKFNFTSDNGIKITAPQQEKKVIDAGVSFLQKALLNLYSTDFLKKNLPFSIILAEQIQMDSYGETTVMSSYASGSFLAIGNITAALSDMTQEEFVKARAELNANFWAKYMSQVRGVFTVPDDFYAASEEIRPGIYDEDNYLGDVAPEEIDFYQYGLISYNKDNSFVEPDWDMYYIYAPSKEEDLSQWMNFVFEKTAAELQPIFEKYPVMKKKYDIIREAMLANGFDLTKLEL